MSLPGILATGKAAEGALIAAVYHADEPRPSVARFTAFFEQRYHRVPDAVAAVGYDAIHLLVHAMRRAPTVGPADIAQALRTLAPWPGVTGVVQFDSLGNAVDKHFLKVRITNGRFVFVESTSDRASVATLSALRAEPDSTR